MVKGGLTMENKLDWKLTNIGWSAEYNNISYYIETWRGWKRGFRFCHRTVRSLFVTVNGITDHVTGGQSLGKLHRLAEKDLDRRLTLIN